MVAISIGMVMVWAASKAGRKAQVRSIDHDDPLAVRSGSGHQFRRACLDEAERMVAAIPGIAIVGRAGLELLPGQDRNPDPEASGSIESVEDEAAAADLERPLVDDL